MAAGGVGFGVVLGASVLALAACSGRTGNNHADVVATSGAGGQVSGGGKSNGSAGSKSAEPTGGVMGETGGEGGVRDPGGNAGEAPMGNEGGRLIAPIPPTIHTVKPSPGCGLAPIQPTAELVKYTVDTSGFKDETAAAHTKGAWSYLREYYVWLPPEYDPSHAYPLVIQAPNCGGTGDNVYSLSPTNDEAGVGINGSVIRVGLTPPPNDIGHSTNPNQGCFDEREGDQSVEFVFYEKLIDRLKTEVCYDEQRVFTSGVLSGGWLANALACKYAGNTEGYAVRGLAAVGPGGLSYAPAQRPTCSGEPLTGMWLVPSDLNDPLFWRNGVDQALLANGCSTTPYYATDSTDYSLGDQQPPICRKIVGCPDAYPLVVCNLQGSSYDTALINRAFAVFIDSFQAR